MNVKVEFIKTKYFFGIICLFLGIFPWITYAFSIHIGLESFIDEGLMLLLLSTPKPLYLSSQSGILIGMIMDHFNYDAISLLWMRFVFQIISVSFLCLSSFVYLKVKVNKDLNVFFYCGFFFFVNSLCLFLFTKTISYNHVQQALVLINISLFIFTYTYSHIKWLKNILLIIIGFVCFISILNILPSGIVTTLLLFIIIFIQYYPSLLNTLKEFVYIMIGFSISIIVFHLFVKDLHILYQEIDEMFLSISKLNRSYDSFSLIFNFVKSFFSILIVSILSLGILYFFESIYFRFKQYYLNYLITFLCIICAILYWLKYTKTGEISEWIFAPVFVSSFLNIKKNRNIAINNSIPLIIYLVCIPFLAPIGTNLLISSKFGYFLGCWFVVTIILSKQINKRYIILSYLIFAITASVWNIKAYYNLQKMRNECTTMTSVLFRLKDIYITKKQKVHFEGVHAKLKEHGFTEGDTIIAFQPDLMTVFSVAGNPGRRVYFVPADFLNDNITKIKRPKYFILNDYSYQQIKDSIKPWGFPDEYVEIDIGTPETVNYFDSNKPRKMFCLIQK